MDQFNNSTYISRCPHDPENPYLQVSRALIRDNSISPECRWLIIYLLANKDNWKIYIKKLTKDLKGHIGKNKIYKLIDEAIDAGYMVREKFLEKNLERCRYFVSESPRFKNKENPQKASPKERKSLRIYPRPENRDAGDGDPEKRDYKNNKPKERTPPPNTASQAQQHSPGDPGGSAAANLKKSFEKSLSPEQVKRALRYHKQHKEGKLRKTKNPIGFVVMAIREGLDLEEGKKMSVIEKRVKWAKEHEYSAPGGSAMAQKEGYVVTSGSGSVMYRYDSNDSFWCSIAPELSLLT